MKMQITLFTGVIETKFENPQKGLESLFKNLFLFFCWRQNSRRYSEKKTASWKWWLRLRYDCWQKSAENPPTSQYMCIIFHICTCADMKYYARLLLSWRIFWFSQLFWAYFILATVSRVLTSAKKQKQILKEGFGAFSWVFEFCFYDTYEQRYLPFCVPIHFRFKLEQNVREKVYRYLEKRNHKSLHV